MQLITSLLILLPTLATKAQAQDPIPINTGRACSLRIGLCPVGQSCQQPGKMCGDEFCPGVCVILPTFSSTLAAQPTPMRKYSPCGGHTVRPLSCQKDEICIDDPYRGGCGMACDASGICVKPVYCGGSALAQCKEGLKCVRDPRPNACDRSMTDCGGRGLCV
jgi:hypothetical protein